MTNDKPPKEEDPSLPFVSADETAMLARMRLFLDRGIDFRWYKTPNLAGYCVRASRFDESTENRIGAVCVGETMRDAWNALEKYLVGL